MRSTWRTRSSRSRPAVSHLRYALGKNTSGPLSSQPHAPHSPPAGSSSSSAAASPATTAAPATPPTPEEEEPQTVIVHGTRALTRSLVRKFARRNSRTASPCSIPLQGHLSALASPTSATAFPQGAEDTFAHQRFLHLQKQGAPGWTPDTPRILKPMSLPQRRARPKRCTNQFAHHSVALRARGLAAARAAGFDLRAWGRAPGLTVRAVPHAVRRVGTSIPSRVLGALIRTVVTATLCVRARVRGCGTRCGGRLTSEPREEHAKAREGLRTSAEAGLDV